jgi:hypothetical protein
MVDVIHNKCPFSGCKSRPSYDVLGGKGEFCVKHKSDNMVDVVSKRCNENGCFTQPSYSYTSERPSYCFLHKKENMVNVKNKKCEYINCSTFPNYDYLNGKGRFCVKHKLESMIDVNNIYCNECTTRASYGKPGCKVSHCAKHRKPGMIQRPNNKCTECKKPAIYGTTFIAKHCEEHKLSTEHNLVENKCVSCGLIMILNKYNNCEYCNPETFQSAKLEKQNSLMDYLDTNNLKGISTDKIISNGECGKERPDRVFDFVDKIVIVECDEYQHRDRDCVCEQIRMINISQSFGGTPVYFIRWNPDNYIIFNSKKQPDKLSIRYKLLKGVLFSIQTEKIILPKSLCSVFYMYYDDWNGIENEKWNILI